MTDSEQALAQTTSAQLACPRVLVLSYRGKPLEGLFEHVTYLLERGVQVDLLTLRESGWADLRGYDNFRVISLKRCEDLYLPRRLERLLLFKIPGKVISLSRRLVEKLRIAPLHSVMSLLERIHEKVADGIHSRIFLPIDSLIRPYSLAVLARRTLDRLDLSGVERIIATEGPTWPSAWRLAHRCPQIEATTALDRAHYATLDISGQAPSQVGK